MEEVVRKKNKFVIFTIIIFILVIGFLAFSFFTKSFLFKEKARPTNTEFTYPMEEMVINLKGDNSREFLKTQIILGYSLEKDVKILEEKKFQLQDTILSILRNKSKNDIMPVENVGELKNEIKKQLNKHFDEAIVTDIYITEFIIQ